jgi:hypothetical protein
VAICEDLWTLHNPFQMRHRPVCHPNYWSLLSEDDKAGYQRLQFIIAPLGVRTPKKPISIKFAAIIQQIWLYVTHGPSDQWKRELACGIIWLNDIVLVNTHQLSILIGLGRSAINQGLLQVRYEPVPLTHEYAINIIQSLPFLGQAWNELRQWTLRKHMLQGSTGSSSASAARTSISDSNAPQLRGNMDSPENDICPSPLPSPSSCATHHELCELSDGVESFL